MALAGTRLFSVIDVLLCRGYSPSWEPPVHPLFRAHKPSINLGLLALRQLVTVSSTDYLLYISDG